ncbi:MAG: right-handed parallel beta-helix repeat-containing protein [Candidatus Eisenbacteria bacterium]|uniref:Right-handed parallel beta-helix repeat-containing protein n=1 Tax=Eiseniibacteriota bacterium TaxID=2212470 RepID=A0A956LVR2_UNCEI|nr:right-handed parallel beta-helix repeat-containing protein [Candidatus Eisenbacteria bacterium]
MFFPVPSFRTRLPHVSTSSMRRLVPFIALISGFVVFGTAGRAGAATYHVEADGSGDFPTIQAALAAAVGGDHIVLGDGTYAGAGNRDLNFLGKGVVLESASADPNGCVIDCEYLGRGVNFITAETRQAQLLGVTITHGAGDGAGIYCYGSSPTIRDCILRENGSNSLGAGIRCLSDAFPLMQDCLITENTSKSGGGIYLYGARAIVQGCEISGNHATAVSGGGVWINLNSSLTLDHCTITGNDAANSGGGVYLYFESTVAISDCLIAGNSSALLGGGIFGFRVAPSITNTVITGNRCQSIDGGGVYLNQSAPIFTGCTIGGNYAGGRAGGLALDSGSNATVNRSIVWGDCAGDGSEVYLTDAGSQIHFDCSDVDPMTVTGPGSAFYGVNAFTADPQFCDARPCTEAPTVLGDYRLDAASPCAPESAPAICGLVGALDVGCGAAHAPGDETTIQAEIAAFPNPSDGAIEIRYAIPRAPGSESGPLDLGIFDATGRLIRAWVLAGGERVGSVAWDGRDRDGHLVPAGTYFCRVAGPNTDAAGRLIRLRR